MRNKIKQLLQKEDGFTLVELLGVIVILGIILAIAIPSVSGIINKTENDAREAEIEMVYNRAQLYTVDNASVKVDDVTFQQLIENKLITKEELTDLEIAEAEYGTKIKVYLDNLNKN